MNETMSVAEFGVIPPSAFHAEQRSNGFWIPCSVTLRCGKCATRVAVTLNPSTCDAASATIIARADCPVCRAKMTIVATGCHRDHQAVVVTPYTRPASIVVYPRPREAPKPRIRVDALPQRLARDYLEVLRAWDDDHWGPVSASCRRILEGALKGWLAEKNTAPSSSAPLADLIEAVAKSASVAQPLHSVATAIRKAGNASAHFTDQEATRESAAAMIRLLEMAIEYVFGMAREAADFEAVWKGAAIGEDEDKTIPTSIE